MYCSPDSPDLIVLVRAFRIGAGLAETCQERAIRPSVPTGMPDRTPVLAAPLPVVTGTYAEDSGRWPMGKHAFRGRNSVRSGKQSPLFCLRQGRRKWKPEPDHQVTFRSNTKGLQWLPRSWRVRCPFGQRRCVCLHCLSTFAHNRAFNPLPPAMSTFDQYCLISQRYKSPWSQKTYRYTSSVRSVGRNHKSHAK
jgi:hypothetical protein